MPPAEAPSARPRGGPERAAGRVLLVEDDAELRRAAARRLRAAGYAVAEEGEGGRAVERLTAPGVEAFDVVVTDLRLPGAEGTEVLRAARERDSRTAVLLATAYGSVPAAVDAMRRGAFDVLEKPFALDALEARVERAVAHARLGRRMERARTERAAPGGAPVLHGESPALRRAVELAERAAASRATVLVTGETGTGKELLAGLVHARSPRAKGPLVCMNCAAVPETLLESELFGHERGAFTSADRTRVGRFEQAHGGTLFLDEVGDMAFSTQAKLLRVLQDGEIRRVGGTRTRRADVRIVAATNQDLEALVRRGLFREDLYFRLAVIGIHLPPLRERPDDVEVLARHFLEGFARDLGRPGLHLDAAAVERLRARTWPGNVRELRNAVERAALLAEGDRIGPEHLAPPEPEARVPEWATGWRPGLPPGGLALDEVERAVVLEALERTGYVQKHAARWLRVSRRKLNYMIRRMGITHPSWRRNREEGGAAEPPGAAAAGEPDEPESSESPESDGPAPIG